MPTNLYGPGDNYHPENSHVIPALIRRFHEAKLANAPSVTVWGTGTPKREFLYSEDMADACVYLMNLPDEKFVPLLGQDRNDGLAPLVNIGVGHDLTIRELAETVASRCGLSGHARIRRHQTRRHAAQADGCGAVECDGVEGDDRHARGTGDGVSGLHRSEKMSLHATLAMPLGWVNSIAQHTCVENCMVSGGLAQS